MVEAVWIEIYDMPYNLLTGTSLFRAVYKYVDNVSHQKCNYYKQREKHEQVDFQL